jgi:NADPH2:quinone reductase
MSALTKGDRKITVATSRSGAEPLTLVELPARPVRARDVRVRVAAIGVNPVDWKMRSGGPLRFAHRFLGPSGPLVVGVDFAGEVIEVGPEADLKVGARVVGATDFSRGQLGSYATEVVVRDDQCVTLPDGLSFEHAACLPVPGATALRAFEVARLSEAAPNDVRLLVLGASGGVGIVTLQLARAMGWRAVGICSTRNVALVESLGATAVDYTQGDALAAARAHGPFQLVFHCVGTEVYALGASRALLTRRGVDALAVVRPADVPSMLLRRSVKSVLGRPVRDNLVPLVRALAQGDIVPLIEERFSLAEAEKAHEISKAGKVVGKLLLLP